jgi:hypothetical protein
MMRQKLDIEVGGDKNEAGGMMRQKLDIEV